MIEKPLDQITEADLAQLVTAQASETRTLEFKEALPGSTKDDRREFLADASAFANTRGGDIVYGIREADSVAAELVGVDFFGLHDEVLRLTNMLRDCVEPRMEFQLHPMQLANGRGALVIRIAQGWNGPYRVLAGDNKFYVRNDKGKHPLDVYELRGAFLRSQVTSARVEEFHAMRLIDIAAGHLPAGTSQLAPDAGRVVLHLLPASAFGEPDLIERTRLYGASTGLQPLRPAGWNHRITAEGFLTHTDTTQSYTHAYRSGIVEAVDGAILNQEYNGRLWIPSVALEIEIVAGVRRYLALLEELGVRPPVTALLALVNAKGRVLALPDTPAVFLDRLVPLDRRVLRLPAVTFPELPAVDVPGVLRPAFDVLWNAFGFEQSGNYDPDGVWKHG